MLRFLGGIFRNRPFDRHLNDSFGPSLFDECIPNVPFNAPISGGCSPKPCTILNAGGEKFFAAGLNSPQIAVHAYVLNIAYYSIQWNTRAPWAKAPSESRKPLWFRHFLREWTFADRSGSYALCVIRPGSAMLAWSILSQGRLKEEWIGT